MIGCSSGGEVLDAHGMSPLWIRLGGKPVGGRKPAKLAAFQRGRPGHCRHSSWLISVASFCCGGCARRRLGTGGAGVAAEQPRLGALQLRHHLPRHQRSVRPCRSAPAPVGLHQLDAVQVHHARAQRLRLQFGADQPLLGRVHRRGQVALGLPRRAPASPASVNSCSRSCGRPGPVRCGPARRRHRQCRRCRRWTAPRSRG